MRMFAGILFASLVGNAPHMSGFIVNRGRKLHLEERVKAEALDAAHERRLEDSTLLLVRYVSPTPHPTLGLRSRSCRSQAQVLTGSPGYPRRMPLAPILFTQRSARVACDFKPHRTVTERAGRTDIQPSASNRSTDSSMTCLDPPSDHALVIVTSNCTEDLISSAMIYRAEPHLACCTSTGSLDPRCGKHGSLLSKH